MTERYIHMGSLCRPHGISGEISVDWYGISPFSLNIPFYLQTASEEPVPVVIENARRKNGKLLVHLEGIASREQAALLRGKKILTLRSCLPPPSEGEAYISDLIGASVLLKDTTYIGRFSHIVAGTRTKVWSIITDTGTEILFPAEEEFILLLDVDHKRIVIDPPAGLLDLYCSKKS